MILVWLNQVSFLFCLQLVMKFIKSTKRNLFKCELRLNFHYGSKKVHLPINLCSSLFLSTFYTPWCVLGQLAPSPIHRVSSSHLRRVPDGGPVGTGDFNCPGAYESVLSALQITSRMWQFASCGSFNLNFICWGGLISSSACAHMCETRICGKKVALRLLNINIDCA